MAAAVERRGRDGEIRLDLSCPLCSHRWQSGFDIVSYLLTELDFWARRSLSQVHALASAYGWSEDRILNLSEERRGRYLELLG